MEIFIVRDFRSHVNQKSNTLRGDFFHNERLSETRLLLCVWIEVNIRRFDTAAVQTLKTVTKLIFYLTAWESSFNCTSVEKVVTKHVEGGLSAPELKQLLQPSKITSINTVIYKGGEISSHFRKKKKKRKWREWAPVFGAFEQFQRILDSTISEAYWHIQFDFCLKLVNELTKNTRNVYFEGSRPEWCISSMIYSGDAPFWSGTLDL